MSVTTFKMKTHSREDITDQHPVNNCIVHGVKPQVLKIVAGKRKEAHYVAVCINDVCNKITTEENKIHQIWNKWNP